MGFKKRDITYFKKEIRKNPMRKLYFDTGIYRIAQMAKEGKAPKISYLTTGKRSKSEDYIEIFKDRDEENISLKVSLPPV